MALAILDGHCMSQVQALVIQEKAMSHRPISSPVSALPPVSFPPERFGPYQSCNLHGGVSCSRKFSAKVGLPLSMVPWFPHLASKAFPSFSFSSADDASVLQELVHVGSGRT